MEIMESRLQIQATLLRLCHLTASSLICRRLSLSCVQYNWLWSMLIQNVTSSASNASDNEDIVNRYTRESHELLCRIAYWIAGRLCVDSSFVNRLSVYPRSWTPFYLLTKFREGRDFRVYISCCKTKYPTPKPKFCDSPSCQIHINTHKQPGLGQAWWGSAER